MIKKREKNKKIFTLKILTALLLIVFSLSILGESFLSIGKVWASTSNTESDKDDYDLYQKYKKFKKYDKRAKYRKYKKYKKKYAFEDRAERMWYKDRYNKYKLYKKDKVTNWRYATYWDDYKRYRNYKHKYKPYRKYKKYKKYNKSKYGKAKYKKYGKDKYKKGYDRYKRQKSNALNLGGGSLGPEIKVGLKEYSKSNLKENSFRITANKNYAIKNKNGNTIATVGANSETRIKRTDGSTLRVYKSIGDTMTNDEVRFEAASSGDNDSIVFTLNNYSSSYNKYRGKMKLDYSSTSNSFWLINTIRLEQYAWGMGEITGTGDMDYNKLMTTSYRTYGYWKIKYGTKYANYGYEVTNTSASQIYYGYVWEERYSRIKTAAQSTRGTIVMYGNRIAITPYSSWTDGKTRSFKDRWGSDNYPWCKSVSDSYGKHPSKGTKQLVSEGNHMVGLSAHGALDLAGNHGWGWDKILHYYFSGINLKVAY